MNRPDHPGSSLPRFLALVGVVVAALALTGASVALAPTSTPTPTGPAPVRVMFLGDSITGGPGCWRAEVWQRLSDDGYRIDAVGPFVRDDCGGVTDAAGRVWDPDNAGYGGITTFGMTAKIVNGGLIEKNRPQLIVMLIGTNDIRGGKTAPEVIDQYTFLLGLYRRYVPDISVVIGTLPPIGPSDCPTCQPVVDEVNALIPGWAAGASTPESPVTVAVLHTNLDVIADTVDEIHPNASGNAKLAAAWIGPIEDALDRIAWPPPPPAPPAVPPGVPVLPWLMLGVAVVTLGGVAVVLRTRRGRAHPIAPGAEPF